MEEPQKPPLILTLTDCELLLPHLFAGPYITTPGDNWTISGTDSPVTCPLVSSSATASFVATEDEITIDGKVVDWDVFAPHIKNYATMREEQK